MSVCISVGIFVLHVSICGEDVVLSVLYFSPSLSQTSYVLVVSLHHPICMSFSLFQASRGATYNDIG